MTGLQMGTPEGTLGTPDTPRILGALGIPAIPETPDTTELLKNSGLQKPLIYQNLIIILQTEISSLMNWIFFPILNWNFVPTLVCKTQV